MGSTHAGLLPESARNNASMSVTFIVETLARMMGSQDPQKQRWTYRVAQEDCPGLAFAAKAESVRTLVYGDSNTYGWIPNPRPPSERMPIDQTWPAVLQKALGDRFQVATETLDGRTSDIADPEAPISGAGLDSAAYFPAAIASHVPLYLVIIMLGKNNTKAPSKRTPFRIALGAGRLVDIASTLQQVGTAYLVSKVLLVCPPALGPQFKESADFKPMFRGALEERSSSRTQNLVTAGRSRVGVSRSQRNKWEDLQHFVRKCWGVARLWRMATLDTQGPRRLCVSRNLEPHPVRSTS